MVEGSVPRIPEFFSGRSILVTGGTGFMGKVLLSKLLLSCPDLQHIYVLIRSSRGKTASERLKEILHMPLFDWMGEDKSKFEKKLVVVEGDIMKLRLGLSEEDYTTIKQTVSIVFHVAATVRFNEPLQQAIFMNTRGTREVVNICLEMKQLVALLHVSTTYSNCEWKEVKEQIYPSSVDWRDAIHIAETVDPAIVNTFSAKFIGKKPNTYTFTKSLAEQVVWDHRHLLPIIIFRPSIVVSTWKDPIPGWLDNVNGPVGVMMGAGQGVLRVSMCDLMNVSVVSTWKDPIPGWLDNVNGPVGVMMGAGQGVLRVSMCDLDVVPDFMPVDVAIRAMVLSAYVRGISGSQNPEEFVVNCASGSSSISNRTMINIGMNMVKEIPLTNALWYPSDDTTTSMTYFTVKSWFAHLLPAIIIDLILRIAGKKPRLLQIQKKIYIAISALSYFTCQEWNFHNEKIERLLDHILPEDKEDFDYDWRDIDPQTYFRQCIVGARIYLLHDAVENAPAGRRWARRLYWLHQVATYGSILLILWLFGLPHRLYSLLSYFSLGTS